MSDIKLTCDQTPFAWPARVSINDLIACTTCGLKIYAPSPGSLQVLTRRQGDFSSAGDGVNIEESNSVGADYRGQRYSFVEAVFHTPGLHIFPQMDSTNTDDTTSSRFSAEYHIHMRTMNVPIRYITIVIPVSHIAKTNVGTAYFAAIAAKPDAGKLRPTLENLFIPTGGGDATIKVLQYQGPDIRGRTADTPTPESCDSTDENQFLLILNVINISAKDLERIPREGSLSTDDRDLPAPNIKPTRSLTIDDLKKKVVLANPGIIGLVDSAPQAVSDVEHIRVSLGNDAVDVSGRSVDINKLLCIPPTSTAIPAPSDDGSDSTKQTDKIVSIANSASMFFGIFIGLFIADMICRDFIWKSVFYGDKSDKHIYIKLLLFAFISFGTAYNT